MNLTDGAEAILQATLPASTTVLIIGGGPVGLLTALALARYGIESVVVERHARRLGLPKAHVMNARTVEILRQYELDLEPLRAVGLSNEEAEEVIFASSMKGIEYGVHETGINSEAAYAASPVTMFNVAQPLFQEHLLKAGLATGKITYVRSHDWLHCTEDSATKHITSTVLLREFDTKQNITSKYLIACDGSNAKSRDILDVSFQRLGRGPDVPLHYASVHFSADLSEVRPCLLWFIINPTAMGIFIAYNRKSSWVYSTQYDPLVTPPTTFTSEYMRNQVVNGVGAPVDDYKDLGITLWQTSPKVADSYRSKRVPHAFLAGDAAHSFPPTGGLGMNSGIADSHNLAWKIHAVEKGWAADNFLDTFSSERSAVARAYAKHSALNEEKTFKMVSLIPGPDVTTDDMWANESLRKEIQDAIKDQKEHFDSLNMVLGYVYGQDNTDGRTDYQKEAVSGARLPHEWVETGAGDRISTLDLVDGHSFVLLTSVGFAVEEGFEIERVPVKVVQLGRDFFDPSGEWTKILGLTQEAAVLVRPDQHIVGSTTSMDKVSNLLKAGLNLNEA
jgi:2,4-dichlorophenol 6-monooxygenase